VIWGIGVESVELLVFNRWGELIWTGNQIGDSWGGTYQTNGTPVQRDVYLYKLTYKFLNITRNTKTRFRVGTVTLIR
jgi:gliding motility-associated-like protein